jgi:predicted Zn finger-like uncharacterized protein
VICGIVAGFWRPWNSISISVKTALFDLVCTAVTQCPNCKSKFNINETSIGKQAKCPKCAKPFAVEPFVETPVAVELPAKRKGVVGSSDSKKKGCIVLIAFVIWLLLAFIIWLTFYTFELKSPVYFVLLILFAIWPVVMAVRKSMKAEDEKAKVVALFIQMKDIYANARKGDITRTIADNFFSCADEALARIPKTPALGWNVQELMMAEIEKMSNQITMLLGLQATTTHVASLGDEIEKLATLRKQGVISDHEFQAFSERFKLATGEKASSVIKAISELYEQHQKGAILEGNYHAALWSLLDKLDRKI